MKKIYKVTQEQLAKLQNEGFIVVDGTTYNYETGSDVAYIVVDPSHPEYALTQTDNYLQFRKNGTVVDSLKVDFSKASSYATKARSLEATDIMHVGDTLYFDLWDGGTINGNTTFNNNVIVKGNLSDETNSIAIADIANKSHTHDIKLEKSSTSGTILEYGQSYKLTAGGKSIVFSMPAASSSVSSSSDISNDIY